MKWVDRYKASLRARRKASLQRKILVAEDRIIYKLHPDYDAAEIRNQMTALQALRQELADIENQEANPDVHS